LAYIGKSKRHLERRAGEHLTLDDSHKSAIKDHLRFCATCAEKQVSSASIRILKKCRTDFDAKIQEALLIKKLNPKLNKQLYCKGASFLLSIF